MSREILWNIHSTLWGLFLWQAVLKLIYRLGRVFDGLGDRMFPLQVINCIESMISDATDMKILFEQSNKSLLIQSNETMLVNSERSVATDLSKKTIWLIKNDTEPNQMYLQSLEKDEWSIVYTIKKDTLHSVIIIKLGLWSIVSEINSEISRCPTFLLN